MNAPAQRAVTAAAGGLLLGGFAAFAATALGVMGGFAAMMVLDNAFA